MGQNSQRMAELFEQGGTISGDDMNNIKTMTALQERMLNLGTTSGSAIAAQARRLARPDLYAGPLDVGAPEGVYGPESPDAARRRLPSLPDAGSFAKAIDASAQKLLDLNIPLTNFGGALDKHTETLTRAIAAISNSLAHLPATL